VAGTATPLARCCEVSSAGFSDLAPPCKPASCSTSHAKHGSSVQADTQPMPHACSSASTSSSSKTWDARTGATSMPPRDRTGSDILRDASPLAARLIPRRTSSRAQNAVLVSAKADAECVVCRSPFADADDLSTTGVESSRSVCSIMTWDDDQDYHDRVGAHPNVAQTAAAAFAPLSNAEPWACGASADHAACAPVACAPAACAQAACGPTQGFFVMQQMQQMQQMPQVYMMPQTGVNFQGHMMQQGCVNFQQSIMPHFGQVPCAPGFCNFVAMPMPMVTPQTPQIFPVWRGPPRCDLPTCVLGSGSYGTVCACWDKRENREVAVKRMHGLFQDLADTERVRREIAIQSKLDHPNVMKLLGTYIPDSEANFREVYLVLEKCDHDLQSHLKLATRATYSIDNAQAMFRDLLAGLAFVHSADVVHRDLKPANCLVNATGQVKIADFGLANTKSVGCGLKANEGSTFSAPECAAEGALTQHIGTRWYRAPEVILNQAYDEKLDIWSAGCILYEMLHALSSSNSSARLPLFQGGSCYPMSPRADQRGFEEADDQLTVIFSILGTPCTEEVEQWLEGENNKQYVERFCPKKGRGFSNLSGCANDQWMHLLRSMLCLNPVHRPSAAGALSHVACDAAWAAPSVAIAAGCAGDVSRLVNAGAGEDMRERFYQTVQSVAAFA